LGKKTTDTKSTSTPWAPAQPILTGAGNDILNTVQGNAGNLQGVESGITGSTIPGLQAQIKQQGKELQPGFKYINSTLSPGFLNTGQSQAQALGDFAGQQAGNAVNSAFSSAGRTGSGNNVTDLARGVTQAELAPMLQNLQYNEGIQNQAAGMLPGYTTSQFAGYTPLLGAQQLAGQLPYYGTQALSGVGNLFGGYGTQTSQQPNGMLNGLLGAGASLGSALIMASDRRLKTNIKLEFRAPDGLGWYSWNWRSNPDGAREEGVIADEVEKLRPQAFVKGFVGGVYDGVNYAALGSVR
jgi:hypothetical protein